MKKCVLQLVSEVSERFSPLSKGKQALKIWFLMLLLVMNGGGAIFAQSGGNSALTSQIQLSAEKDPQALWSYYQQSRDWLELPMATGSLVQELTLVRDFSLAMLQAWSKKEKLASQQAKQALLEEWKHTMWGIEPLDERCLWWYSTMDMMSYAYDFPTALMIAVWRKESNCGYYLPKNGDGPFQIVSKDYSRVSLNKGSFEDMIQDFLLFSKHKISWYNSRNPDTPIRLSYQNFTHADLLKFAALYNGLSWGTVYGDIKPAAPGYYWSRLPGAWANAKRNGLLAQVLKIVEWELKS